MSQPPTLLIVDDSRISRMMIRSLVAEIRPQWQVDEAPDAAEALAKIAAAPPDFVSMDMNMPGQNGLEAARQIRASHPAVRVALFTANIQSTVQAAAASEGIQFVAKPVTGDSVTKAVQFFEA